MMKLTLFLSLLLLTFTSLYSQSVDFKTGDIIFQTSQSSQSQAVQIVTHSKLSHVGVVIEKDGEYLVLEAVQPVRFTPIKSWINRGKNDFFIVKRLKNPNKYFTSGIERKMLAISEKYLGKSYDLHFEWSDEKYYCSELVWKIYNELFDIEIGKPVMLKNFDLKNNAVKTKLAERFGSNIPLNELVISPQAISDSNLLRTVFDNYH